jgi:hypothetical protein
MKDLSTSRLGEAIYVNKLLPVVCKVREATKRKARAIVTHWLFAVAERARRRNNCSTCPTIGIERSVRVEREQLQHFAQQGRVEVSRKTLRGLSSSCRCSVVRWIQI